MHARHMERDNPIRRNEPGCVRIYKYTETANFNFRAVPSGLNPFQRIQLQRHENMGPNSAKKIVSDLENYDTKVLRFRSYKQTQIIASMAFLV